MTSSRDRLRIVPITLPEANAFVAEHHRHHQPVPGAKFCVAVALDENIVGVAIVGRPISRMLDDGWSLEVNRTCTDGTKNANSMLYGACRRAAFALGYRKLITYTLPTESGSSLKAAGWKCLGEAGGGTWSRKSRPRIDTHPTQTKLKWQVSLLGLGFLALSLFSQALPCSDQLLYQKEHTAMPAKMTSGRVTSVSISYPFASSSLSPDQFDRLVAKILPRLRMLRLVLERKPITFCPHPSEPKYVVTYYQETLECGHEFTSYTVNPAKRRNCQACVKEAAQPKKAVGVGAA